MNNPTEIDMRLKPAIQLSDDELRERLRPTYEAIKQAAFSKGSYVTYYDALLCPNKSYAVHEYSDRKDLIWMDSDYQEYFIKTL